MREWMKTGSDRNVPINCRFPFLSILWGLYEFTRTFTAEGRWTRVDPLKLAIFHLMQSHFSEILRCVSVCNIIMKALDAYLMIQRQVNVLAIFEFQLFWVSISLVAPKFADRPIWNSNFRNMSWEPPHMPNKVKIGSRAWAGLIASLSHHFPPPFFVFFTLCTGHAAGPIATLNGSKRADSAKEVPFPGLDDEK